jgi:hypothetical protein
MGGLRAQNATSHALKIEFVTIIDRSGRINYLLRAAPIYFAAAQHMSSPGGQSILLDAVP